MPATTRNATAQIVVKAANHSDEIQLGSMALIAGDAKSYSAGMAKPVDGSAVFGLGVREVLLCARQIFGDVAVRRR